MWKEKLNAIFHSIGGSFKNDKDGYSAKKMTGFAIVICVIATHVKWLSIGDLSQMEMVLTIDFAFIATLFGINTYDKFKNPIDATDKPATP